MIETVVQLHTDPERWRTRRVGGIWPRDRRITTGVRQTCKSVSQVVTGEPTEARDRVDVRRRAFGARHFGQRTFDQQLELGNHTIDTRDELAAFAFNASQRAQALCDGVLHLDQFRAPRHQPSHRTLFFTRRYICMEIGMLAFDVPGDDFGIDPVGLATTPHALGVPTQMPRVDDEHLQPSLVSQIREQLGRGSSESEVIDFMTARYGDFVLYRPPLKASTLLLWVGPFLLLAGGALLLIGRLRKERPPAAQLSDEDRMRAARLLEGGGR